MKKKPRDLIGVVLLVIMGLALAVAAIWFSIYREGVIWGWWEK